MSVALRTPVALEPQNDLSRLKGMKSASLEGEKARLREATREFEAFFTYFMLKTMRQTIPESPLDKGSPFAASKGKDVFTQMFDMEVSRTLASKESNSIGDLLYKSMERNLEAQFGQQEKTPEVLPLERNFIPASVNLRPQPLNLPDPPPDSHEINVGRREPMPLQTQRPTPTDSIMARYGGIIDEAAAATALDSTLIASVIQAESSGDPKAISRAGAKGLMQLIDSTAEDYGVKDVFDPSENILAGSRYLRKLIDRFGDVKLGLAEYNAGPGNVKKYGGIPPFRETQAYVQKVTALRTDAKVE